MKENISDITNFLLNETINNAKEVLVDLKEIQAVNQSTQNLLKEILDQINKKRAIAYLVRSPFSIYLIFIIANG